MHPGVIESGWNARRKSREELRETSSSAPSAPLREPSRSDKCAMYVDIALLTDFGMAGESR
jgi:hypothetical protein